MLRISRSFEGHCALTNAIPFDWYNARISVQFTVTKTNGDDIGADATADNMGIVNECHSFIKKFDVKLNGRKIYDCNDANQSVNIKNLLEYSPTYAQTTASNDFFYLDTNSTANASGANVNRGMQTRRNILGASDDVNTEITLNKFSFFEVLEDELLPNTRLELNLEIESDGNLIWRLAGDPCRVVITRMQLIVPRITFNSECQKLYMEQFLKSHKWTYLRENIERSNSSQQRTGHFNISSGITKPRHVFVFIINDANINAETANPFLYNTFSVSTNPRTLDNCHLIIGNGNEYPEVHNSPSSGFTLVYRDILKYVHANNQYQEGTLLNINNFRSIFPFVYFDLTKQKTDIKDGTTKLTFRYELSGGTATAYSINALTLYEQEAELIQKDGKLLFR